MPLTDHLTNEQLNEFLDNETNDHAQIEAHLSACVDCAARLSTLQDLFVELESLPEMVLSRDLAAPVTRRVSGRASLPPALTLTVTLQAAAAMVAMIFAAPFVMRSISPYVSNMPAPSFVNAFLQVQAQWAAWLDRLSQLRLPALPEIPVADLSSVFLILTVIGVSVLWVIGNGLLLRNQMK